MRQVVLDTETTGLETGEGHRILEVGCVEIIDRKLTRNTLHHYINPQREIDDGALEVHGITREFLLDKPTFADVWDEFLDFVKGAELVIHNAAFDITFLNYEMKLMSAKGKITDHCKVVDSLALARHKHPGQKNNLDALCKRYNIDNSKRELHGALLDAEILADVYLLMTGGQVTLGLDEAPRGAGTSESGIRRLSADRPRLAVIRASDEEVIRHREKLAQLEETSETGCVWNRLDSAGA
ncbi:MAG TPA: DNA polymerase III subunit epsilon [Pseudomonadales bacterium]|nr:DNA polymerase III subunit epsilon [Pseudomonadales bacterium]